MEKTVSFLCIYMHKIHLDTRSGMELGLDYLIMLFLEKISLSFYVCEIIFDIYKFFTCSVRDVPKCSSLVKNMYWKERIEIINLQNM